MIKFIKCRFAGNDFEYTYSVPSHLSVDKNDFVIVEVKPTQYKYPYAIVQCSDVDVKPPKGIDIKPIFDVVCDRI